MKQKDNFCSDLVDCLPAVVVAAFVVAPAVVATVVLVVVVAGFAVVATDVLVVVVGAAVVATVALVVVAVGAAVVAGLVILVVAPVVAGLVEPEHRFTEPAAQRDACKQLVTLCMQSAKFPFA